MQLFSRLGARFSLVLAVTVLATVAVLAGVTIRQLQLFGEYAVEQNRSHILSQAENYLADKTHERARHLEAVFRQAQSHAELLAKRAEQVLDGQALYGPENYNASESLSLHPENRIFTNDRDSVASCVYWGGAELTKEVRREVNVLSHLDPTLRDVKQVVPGAVATWIIASSAMARYYPNIHHVEFMPPPEVYDYRSDLCYLIVAPELNPDRDAVWHEVYLDSMGQGLVITVAAPVYGRDDTFLASCGVDISLSGILEDTLVNDARKGEEGFSFVVDDKGRLIAFPLKELDRFSLDVGNLDDFSPGSLLRYSMHDSVDPEVREAAVRMQEGQGVFRLDLDGETYLLASQPMGAMGWTLGHVVPVRTVLASVENIRQGISASQDAIVERYLGVALAVLACSLAATLVVFNLFFFRPLGKIISTVRRVSDGDLMARSELQRNDEMGTLADAVDEMTGQLELQRNELLAARELYRDLFESAMSGLYRSTPEGRMLSVNKAFADMFGFQGPEQVVDEVHDSASTLYAVPEDRKRLVNDVLGVSELSGREVHMRRRDGSLFWAAISIRAVRDYDGEVAFFEGAVTDITDRKRAEEYRDMLSREHIRIQETERRRLATELHDNLAQELSALKIAFEMLLDDQPDANRATQERLRSCAAMLGRSIADVRGMAQGLGPFGLEEVGLEAMLDEYCTRFAETSGVEVDFNAAGLSGETLHEEATVHVFRIVQEALNNVRKHSGAGRVTVRLVVSHPHLIVRVEDDGKGFDTRRQEMQMSGEMRMGLMSIRERAKLLGGRATIDSVVGRGTRIRVEIPLGGVARGEQ